MLKQGTILKPDVRVRGDDPREVDRLVGPLLRGMAYERLLLLLLDPVYCVKQVHVLGVGNEFWVTCSIRKLFRTVLLNRLHRFVVVHNHPGQTIPSPSVPDVAYARRLEQGADILGLELVDSVIIGEAGFFSIFQGGPGVSAPHLPEGGTEHGA